MKACFVLGVLLVAFATMASAALRQDLEYCSNEFEMECQVSCERKFDVNAEGYCHENNGKISCVCTDPRNRNCLVNDCKKECQMDYGLQASGICQLDNYESRCICIHTGGGVTLLESCFTKNTCPELCRRKWGPQADGTCQMNEDTDRCICLHKKGHNYDD